MSTLQEEPAVTSQYYYLDKNQNIKADNNNNCYDQQRIAYPFADTYDNLPKMQNGDRYHYPHQHRADDIYIHKMKVKESSDIHDACRNIVRIDSSSLILMGLGSGDIVIITNNNKGRKIAAKCMDSMLLEAEQVMRMDKVMRYNLSVQVGQIMDSKSITRANICYYNSDNENDCSKNYTEQINVILEPLASDIPAAVDGEYVTRSLQDVPVIKGQVVMVPYYGGLWFAYVVIGFTIDTMKEKMDIVSNTSRSRPYAASDELVVIISPSTPVILTQ